MTITNRTLEVWDLSDDTVYPPPQIELEPVGPDRGGPIAAAAGLLAFIVAVVPGLPTLPRWCLLIGLGVVAVLVGFAALRRRQILLTVLLAVGGMVLAVLAAGAVILVPPAAAPVENAVLAADSPASTSATVQLTPRMASASLADRTAASDAAARLALHLRAMHGAAGPFPLTLANEEDLVIETGGAIDAVQVGRIPAGMHVRYAVAPDQRFFELRVALDADPAASATADSTIDLSSVG